MATVLIEPNVLEKINRQPDDIRNAILEVLEYLRQDPDVGHMTPQGPKIVSRKLWRQMILHVYFDKEDARIEILDFKISAVM